MSSVREDKTDADHQADDLADDLGPADARG
jgi:hypothetical protein